MYNGVVGETEDTRGFQASREAQLGFFVLVWGLGFFCFVFK